MPSKTKQSFERADDVRSRLLNWYGETSRKLPWRLDPQPYHILVSEFMLQQTRVDMVLPYFETFVSRWPTLEAFAVANIDDVLQVWSGLGYYSRARRLHSSAKLCVQRGGIPRDLKGLLSLPGVGSYSAGAIASIAFEEPTPAVDGNVERVVSRLLAMKEDPRSKKGKSAILDVAEALLQQGSPRDINQALMELGALVCRPRSPDCGHCPLQSLCLAFETEQVDLLPVKLVKPAPKPVRGACGILCGERGVLLGRRSATGLLAGLWEPIGTEWDLLADPGDRLREAFAARAGVVVADLRPLGEVKHVFSHRRLTLFVYDVTARQPCQPTLGEGYDELRWSDESLARPLPLSKLARKTLALAAPVLAKWRGQNSEL